MPWRSGRRWGRRPTATRATRTARSTARFRSTATCGRGGWGLNFRPMDLRQELEKLLALEAPTAADVAKAQSLAVELKLAAKIEPRLKALEARRELAHPTDQESLAATEGAREIAEAMAGG